VTQIENWEIIAVENCSPTGILCGYLKHDTSRKPEI